MDDHLYPARAFFDNTVTSARRSLIDIEATKNATIAYVTIRNNRLGASRFCTLTNGGAPAVEHDFVIVGNRTLADMPMTTCITASPGTRHASTVPTPSRTSLQYSPSIRSLRYRPRSATSTLTRERVAGIRGEKRRVPLKTPCVLLVV